MQDLQGRTGRYGNRLKPCLVIILAGILYALSLSSFVDTEQEYRYLVLGHGMATEGGYRVFAQPDQPAELILPPGYSLLVAAVLRITGDIAQGVLPLRVVGVLSAIGFLWTAWMFFSDRTSQKTALVLTCFMILTPAMMAHSGIITPAMWYAFLSLLILFVVDRRILTDRSVGMAGSGIAGVLGGLLFMVHPFAITVALTIGICLAQQKRYRETGVFTLGFMLAITPWCAWIFTQTGDSFLSQFLLRDPDLIILGRTDLTDLVLRAVRHAWTYLALHVPGSLLPYLADRGGTGNVSLAGFGLILTIIRLGISGLIIWGVCAGFLRHWSGIYIMVCGGFILIWPWADSSLLLPVLPVLWLSLYHALTEIRTRQTTDTGRRLVFACAAIAIVGITTGNIVRNIGILQNAYAHRRGDLPPEARALRDTIAWLRTETARDDVFMCIDTARFYGETDRKTVRPPDIPAPEAIVRILLRYDVDYVISMPARGRHVSDLNALLVAPIVKRFDEVFIPVYQSPHHPDTIVYAVSKSASNRMAHNDAGQPLINGRHETDSCKNTCGYGEKALL